MKNDLEMCLTCKFKVFAQAYTGTFDSEKIFELAKDGIFYVQQNIKNVQKHIEPICDEDLMACWEEYVEIRAKRLPNGNFELMLDVIGTGNPTKNEYNLTCDCCEFEQMVGEIVKETVLNCQVPVDWNFES